MREEPIRMTASGLRDESETAPTPEETPRTDERAFEQASAATDPEPITSLGNARHRGRRSKESIALLPAEVEARTAAVKLRAKQLDVGLKKTLAYFAVGAVALQLVVADLILMRWIVFGEAAPSDPVLVAWLSATVVEVIGIVAIVARNLFPGKSRGKRSGSPAATE
jgi:hypothetical protein